MFSLLSILAAMSITQFLTVSVSPEACRQSVCTYCAVCTQCAHRFPLRLSWILLSLFCKLSNITLKVICTCVHCNIFYILNVNFIKHHNCAWISVFLNSRNQSNHKAFLTVSKGICVVLFVGKKAKACPKHEGLYIWLLICNPDWLL